ncbi:hypothetical protein QTA58_22850 [Neorhizobium sp. CSC1952]|uniref:hypothetical protein n=1 Tax=Neorhizobium sp. CSC1952 TaxID=2978974 RepID=UPI0025A53FFC|nr:hypothetical protein [Rhizobium sp. CSC1952]WJR66992.1 hypothetical protein QTA58_22850 [Rhizobium sp. CSC1952]
MNHIHVSKPEFADKHENARLKTALASHTSALAERDARIAELEAALKPFAWIANLLDNCGYDDAEFVDDDDAAFQAGDFRRARAALVKEQADA